MKRLGMFSGKVYEESEVKNMNECGVCITDEEANDDNFITNHHMKDLMHCVNCFGCPRAKGFE